MISRERAYQLRQMIVKASASLADDDALEAIELFAPWAADTDYAADVRVRYGEKLYRCVQAHHSQTDWMPDATPALWTEVAAPGVIPVWQRPEGAHDAYRIGAKVRYPDENGPVYTCISDYNIYSPDEYPAGWRREE